MTIRIALAALVLAFPLAHAPALAAGPLRGPTIAIEDVHLKSWPKPDNKDLLTKAVSKIRKARNEEMAATGHTELLAMGAAACPSLLKALSKEKDEEARFRIVEALDAITDVPHTRLLAEHLEDKSANLRRYVAVRIAVIGDAGLKTRAEGLLAAILERKADPKKGRKVADEDIEALSIMAFGTGSLAGVEPALALATKDWSDHSDVLTAAAARAKAAGDDVPDALAAALGKAAKAKDKVAVLRLLTHAGSKQHARSVGSALDAEENQVKVAAINALRVIVDGDKPLKSISTFDAIDRAKKWKARL